MSSLKKPSAPRAGIGGRLTIYRRRLGLTQAEAAARFGVSKPTWVRYETADKEPKASMLLLLATEGLNPQWLLFGKGPMTLEGRQKEMQILTVREYMGDKQAARRLSDSWQDTLADFRVSSETVRALCDELGYTPDSLWFNVLLELVHIHTVPHDGVKRIIEALKQDEKKPPNPK